MFDNIGGKIKEFATFLTIAGIIASVISGIAIISNSYAIGYGPIQGIGILIGFLVIILGSIISWVSSLVLYGFGQLVKSVQNIERELTGITDESEPQKPEIDYISDSESISNSKISNNYLSQISQDQSNSKSTGLILSDGVLRCATCNNIVEPGDPICTHCKMIINWNSVLKK